MHRKEERDQRRKKRVRNRILVKMAPIIVVHDGGSVIEVRWYEIFQGRRVRPV